MRKDKKISVIIPVMNEGVKIGLCLDSIFNQTLKPFEVIIVDGHSIDNTVEVAKSYPVKIVYEEYRTRAGACNVGLEHASGEYVAFTDADCIPDKGWLEMEFNVLQRRNDAGGVGCCIDNISEGLWEESINEISKTFFGSGRSVQGRQFRNERNVVSISGCHSLYRKSVLEEVGGFNVKLKTCEDTEINKRILKSGYNLVYTPKTRILHNHTRGTRMFAKRMFQYGEGRANSRLFDIQLLFPLSFPILFLLGIINLYIFALVICFYFLLLLVLAVFISVKKKKYQFLFTVPFILILQHLSYSFGFWKGLLIREN